MPPSVRSRSPAGAPRLPHHGETVRDTPPFLEDPKGAEVPGFATGEPTALRPIRPFDAGKRCLRGAALTRDTLLSKVAQ